MFEPVSSKASFPELEKRIIELWKERRIFERSVEERRAGPLFVLYEGPPTANASPGVHHVLSRVFKDAIPRYKTMKGYCCPRKAGWDTHGLPVELEIERELGLSSKAEIEAYGVARFNARCRDSVFRYVREWDDLTERIAFWVDMEHPYITLHNEYIESCWWIVKQLWDSGLMYQGYRVTPHCPRCGTSLSSHEVALGYDEADDPSVYIKFRVDPASIPDTPLDSLLQAAGPGLKPVYLLAWTTTPWTLPGNTALAVAPDADYSVMEGENDYLIMASALVSLVGLEDYREAGRVAGEAIAGTLTYEPLYNPHTFDIERKRFRDDHLTVEDPDDRLRYRVIDAGFVSMEDGTGIVHVAPSFGDVDYEAGQDRGLDFVRDYVDLQGMVRGTYPFAGRFVKEADPLILEDLKSRGLLYRSETVRHTYPFCWRCRTPLLYYAKPSWYIRTTARKDRLISGNDEINWYPEHIKRGRFGDWLENNVDWAVSRERYWGTPLPIWRCDGCGREECVGSVAELKAKPGFRGLEEPLDLHRPFVDAVSFECNECHGRMQRLPDVLDAWFDSGAMPVCQWHYPFENADTFKRFFPADYICEAVDQTRGWFYTLHALSTLLFDQPCFRNVICLGHILDAQGEKMSKSKGNVVDPWSVIDKHGADALRWYLVTSSPAGSVRRFSAQLVGEGLKRFILTLWNVYSFFVTYANIDSFDPRAATGAACDAELDRWILSELNQVVDRVTRALEGYDPTDAGRAVQDLVEDLSNWYVRRSRRRFWKSENDADKLAAYATLYHCLVTVAKLLAPLTPFLAEELYQNLVRSVYPDEPESVHLATFPEADLSRVDEQLTGDTHLAMKVSSLGRSARSKAGIKVRQPLARVVVGARPKGEREGLARVRAQVLEELNVKEMEFADSLDSPDLVSAEDGGFAVAIDTHLTPELADEGLAREIVHRLQTMRKQAGFDIADYIVTYFEGGEALRRVVSGFADYIKQETLSRDLAQSIPPDAYRETHRLAGEEMVFGVKKLPL
ncbi:MAG: isoleucine--tRNA ligase [Chloroflexota bacterium]|nr:isoleucine--tRNA ligase [Chloroflexota bacterium]